MSSQDDKRTIFRLAVPVALKTAAGLPLSGCVRIQHSGTLHPWPDSVHPGTDGLLFHTTPAPLNAVLNPEHENRLLSPSQSALASFDRSVKKRQGEVYGWAGVTAFVSISASSLKQKIERRAKRNARCQHPGLGTPCNKQTNKKTARLDWRSLWSSVRKKKKSNVTLRNNRIKNGLRWGLDQMSSSRDFFSLYFLLLSFPVFLHKEYSLIKSHEWAIWNQPGEVDPCGDSSLAVPLVQTGVICVLSQRNPIWLSLGTKHKQTNPKGRRKRRRRREWLRTQGRPPNISKAELPLAVHPTTKPVA